MYLQNREKDIFEIIWGCVALKRVTEVKQNKTKSLNIKYSMGFRL